MSEAQIKAEYKRQEPEKDLIYKTIKNHWPKFLRLAESPGQNSSVGSWSARSVKGALNKVKLLKIVKK